MTVTPRDPARHERVVQWLRTHGLDDVADRLERDDAKATAEWFRDERELDDGPPWTLDVLNSLAEGDDGPLDVLLRLAYDS